jgi:hypothetical protein
MTSTTLALISPAASKTSPPPGFYQWNEDHPIESDRVREFFQPERIPTWSGETA